MKVVIIGAGSSGLYTAYKFYLQGFTDIDIYDPRAGKYTRPGLLDELPFICAEESIGINLGELVLKGGHIKELDRALYEHVKALEGQPNVHMRIMDKAFVRMHADQNKPGVVVSGDDGVEEIVEADMVVDASGSKHVVVSDINENAPNSSLKLSTFAEPAVRNHFLAYVKIDNWPFSKGLKKFSFYPQSLSPADYAEAMMKLRAFGWKEFALPRCYANAVGKGKVCLYLHAPEKLDPKKHEAWVQTVLNCHVPGLSYTHVKPSRKYGSKPRFLPFPMNAEITTQPFYKGTNLPMVVPVGDAQIGFDYAQGHGISDGMRRINVLFNHLAVTGNIIDFDTTGYAVACQPLLDQHKTAMLESAEYTRQAFKDSLEQARVILRIVADATQDPQLKTSIASMRKEIILRHNYLEAVEFFSKQKQDLSKIFTIDNIHTNIYEINKIQAALEEAYLKLPPSFIEEHKEAKNLLLNLASHWKDLGNGYFITKNKDEASNVINRNKAIDSYNKALQIYKLLDFDVNHSKKAIVIYSNLTITHIQNKQFSKAIEAANAGLELLNLVPQEMSLLPVQEKLIVDLIKAMHGQAQEKLQVGDTSAAEMIQSQMQFIISIYQSKLSDENTVLVKGFTQSLEQVLLPSQSKPSIGGIFDRNVKAQSNKAESLNPTLAG